MLNFPIIYKAIGTLLYLEAMLLSFCMGVGLFYNETNYFTFGIPITVAIGLGFLLRFIGRNAENRMGRRDGFLIVSVTWIIFSLIGMLPLYISNSAPNPVHAFFETISGFTTTGATVLTNIDSLQHSVLTWRSLTHWIGGMGIVFFTIAVLPNMGGSETKLFSAEATGLKIGKLHPRISTTARWLWSIYLLLTLSCAGSYYLGGMGIFDAINHGLSTIGTGGFSTHQDSLAYFKSTQLEWIATIFMFLASINFTLLYLFFIKRRFSDVLHDGELRCFLSIFFSAALFFSGILFFFQDYTIGDALRYGFFNTAAIQSTTGFTCIDFMAWLPITHIIFILLMMCGACAGSTSGGLKCIRILMVGKLTRNEFKQLLHPHAIFPIRINGTPITTQVGRTVFVFFAIYIIILVLGTSYLVCRGLPITDAFGIVVTSFGNVGPCVGTKIGALGSWDVLSNDMLLVSSFIMLAGRLEIFSLLLPFIPAFWKDK